MKEHAFRLTRGNDLKLSIEKYCEDNKIQAGVILSCVGCLSEANIRNASGVKCIKIDKDIEIVSITGTVSQNGCHIHISVSDEELKTYGGHLKDGCIVNTTAEIVIIELSNYKFDRTMDENTGYKELTISELV